MRKHNIYFLNGVFFLFIWIVFGYFMIDTMGFGFEHEGLIWIMLTFWFVCIALAVFMFVSGVYELDKLGEQKK